MRLRSMSGRGIGFILLSLMFIGLITYNYKVCDNISNHINIVYVLYMYCICIVFVLYMYCICIVYVVYRTSIIIIFSETSS